MRQLPELFDVRVQARSLAYLFATGAVLGLATLAFPHGEDVKDLQLIALAAIAIAIATVVYLRAERARLWQMHLALAAGSLILTFANYFVGEEALYPILFTWTALYGFYFFELRAALLQVVFIGVSYAVLLAIQDPASPLVRWLLAVGTPTVAGLLISRLLERLRAEIANVEERQRALSENESRTRLVLDSAPDAYVAIDADGTVRTWNAAAERLFGWTASEAIGQRLRDLIFPPDDRGGHDERRRDLLVTDDPVQVIHLELDLQRRDGSIFPAEETVSRVRIGDDIVLSGFIRDISERRRREGEREALLREQAARAEAERVAEMVSGMQLLVDAALVHRRIDDILADLVTRVRGVLGADAATIFLAEDGDRLVVRASSVGSDSGNGARGAPPFAEAFAGKVAAEREPMLANDVGGHDLDDPSLRELEIGSLIGVPLLADGEVTGVLVTGAVAPRRFSEEDLALLRLAADRVGLAIDHARVYAREHRIAETLQRSLLPDRLPQLPGLAAAARYLPAATEAEVGGDWYDVIPIPGGGVGLVMGDVAGKGLAAASMVGRLRSALRAYALEGHDPALVVEQLNRLVWTEADESQMATLLLFVVDPSHAEVRWVNAGHLPPLMVPPNGRAPSYLDGGRSVPLGVLPFPTFEEARAELEPGATVVLYTDGLVERPGEHLDEGLAELADVVREGPQDPEGLSDHVLRRLVPEGGASDDVALLVLQNTPVRDRFEVEFPTHPEALVSMRGLLRRWLRHADGSEQEIAEITTACGEAATNAIEHAGAGGGTPFEVAGRVGDGEVDITVRDYGAWRAPRSGDQGRGLSLMQALMDSVEVTPSPEGTIVRLRRRLDGAGAENGASE